MSTETSKSSHRGDRALWIVAIMGLIVLAFAAASRGDTYNSTAHRTDRFTANKVRSLSVENIGGDIQISEGAVFSAVAEVTVRAANASDAKRYLDQTKVEFEKEDDGSATLVTREPGATVMRRGRGWSIHVDRDKSNYRVETRYQITLPADAELDVHTVNGNVTVQGIAAATDVNSVNGRVRVSGTRHDLRLHTVNGAIEGTASELPRGARVDAETVNGNIELHLPARAGFHVTGQTMNGDIVSTFPLPVKATASDAERLRSEHERMRAERDRIQREIQAKERESAQKERESARKNRERDDDNDSDDVHIDMSGLRESLQELSSELAEIGPEIAASISENLHRSYEGSVAGGGAEVRCSTLNGRIAILSDGSSVGDAKSLLPRRSHGSSWAAMPVVPPVPSVPSVAPVPPVPPVPTVRAPRVPRPPRHSMDEEGSIVRGDIAGDFATTLPFGDVQLGKVSGNVRVALLRGGDVHDTCTRPGRARISPLREATSGSKTSSAISAASRTAGSSRSEASQATQSSRRWAATSRCGPAAAWSSPARAAATSICPGSAAPCRPPRAAAPFGARWSGERRPEASPSRAAPAT